MQLLAKQEYTTGNDVISKIKTESEMKHNCFRNKLLAVGSALNYCDDVIPPVSRYPSVATTSIATAAYALNRLWAKVSPENVEENVESCWS